MKTKILVFGAVNIDKVYELSHIVRPGETITSDKMQLFPGGKGLNQAIALKRAGADVFFAGQIGHDGKHLKALLKKNKINTDNLEMLENEYTGNAIIQVEENGQNSIILYPGTNRMITAPFIDNVLSGFEEGDWILLQNEISNISYLIDAAYAKGINIAFNPSPFDDEIKSCDLNKVKIFFVNEVEAQQITGYNAPDAILEEFGAMYPQAEVILTMGKDGAYYGGGKIRFRQKAFEVDAVDTTAAGDTFTGYFLAQYVTSENIQSALKNAAAASSVSVTRKGAACSIPEKKEVEDMLSKEEDIYRPRYHFRPADNWMNDPNGPLFYKGEYHLFYQYNPNADKWGTIHWGHAKSEDLIHWKECPIALYPETEKGELHCYSGCAFEKNGIPVIYYTSVGEGDRGPEEGAIQRYAVSRDGLMSWEKGEIPVLNRCVHETPKENIHIAMWRDPFVWKEEDGYYMLLGGTRIYEEMGKTQSLQDGNGCIALYYSSDAQDWCYKNMILESEEFWLLECPNMIKLGDYYLLLYSPLDAVRYRIGKLDKQAGSFYTIEEGIFDYSIRKTGFYAPNTFLNMPDERKITVGWLSEADRGQKTKISGWAGMLSLPREVSIEDGKLCMRPAKEIMLLRKEKVYEYTGGENSGLFLAKGRTLEIQLKLNLTCINSEFELRILENPDRSEYTSIQYCGLENKLSLLREHSSLWDGCGKDTIEAKLDKTEYLFLHIYIDCSAVEIFINESFTMSGRVYPSGRESECVRIEKNNGMGIEQLDIWRLAFTGL